MGAQLTSNATVKPMRRSGRNIGSGLVGGLSYHVAIVLPKPRGQTKYTPELSGGYAGRLTLRPLRTGDPQPTLRRLQQLVEQRHPLVAHRHGVVHLVHVAAAVFAKLPA